MKKPRSGKKAKPGKSFKIVKPVVRVTATEFKEDDSTVTEMLVDFDDGRVYDYPVDVILRDYGGDKYKAVATESEEFSKRYPMFFHDIYAVLDWVTQDDVRVGFTVMSEPPVELSSPYTEGWVTGVIKAFIGTMIEYRGMAIKLEEDTGRYDFIVSKLERVLN